MSAAFPFTAVPASDVATRVDLLFYGLTAVCGLVAFAIATVIVFFCVRYRRGSTADRRNPPVKNRVLESTWTIVPLVLFVGIYFSGAVVYASLYKSDANAMTVFVVGKQWMWRAQHPNGRREINELHLPLGQPVRVVLATEDAIHSFYVPAFRIKQDAVPGRYTSLRFVPTRAGAYRLLCAEYCGTDHAAMGGRIIVLPVPEFTRWLESGNVVGLAARGLELFRSHGCSGCHDPRSSVHAPDLKGIDHRVVHLADGRTVIADEAYLRDSILQPRKDVVAGFDPIMPSYQGQLDEDEIAALIQYLKETR